MAKKKTEPRLRIIPLGGLGEIGKNMTVFVKESPKVTELFVILIFEKLD